MIHLLVQVIEIYLYYFRFGNYYLETYFSHNLYYVGSLLVAAAHYGGYVFGVDIDFLMIHGKTKPTRKQTRVSYMNFILHFPSTHEKYAFLYNCILTAYC